MGADANLNPLRFLSFFGRRGDKKISPDQDALSWIALRDHHPQWGRFHLRLYADGRLRLHLLDALPEAQRFSFQLAPAILHSLEKLVREHNLMNSRIQDRAGLPDEQRATLEVHWQSGMARAVAKWSSDEHPAFDAIQKWLLNLLAQVYYSAEPQGRREEQ